MKTGCFIGNRGIGVEHEPFIIAEMSGNHNQSLDKALEIVEAAAKSGAHALKIQTYTAETMTLDLDTNEFFIQDPGSLWKGKSLYELYKEAYTPWEWHKPIFERCKKLGIIGFSSPFDNTAVDFLESLDVPCYKIASFENVDLPLIRKVAATGKPIIASTGMATVEEIHQLVNTVKKANGGPLILLKCTSSYPASPKDSNIRTIPHMRDLFNCEVGLSDHTFGLGVAVASVAMGATVIEKHLTLSRAEGGVDSVFSLEPSELEALVTETKRAWEGMGHIQYEPSEKEKKSMQFRRSIYIAKDIKQGELFTEENLRVIRPGYGLEPKYYEIFIGRKANCDIAKGTPLSWNLL